MSENCKVTRPAGQAQYLNIFCPLCLSVYLCFRLSERARRCCSMSTIGCAARFKMEEPLWVLSKPLIST